MRCRPSSIDRLEASERASLDRALDEHGATLRSVAAHFHLSCSALQRYSQKREEQRRIKRFALSPELVAAIVWASGHTSDVVLDLECDPAHPTKLEAGPTLRALLEAAAR